MALREPLGKWWPLGKKQHKIDSHTVFILVIHLPADLSREADWNYRITDQRLIVIKTKNLNVRKAAALDILTNLPFTLNIPENVPLDDVEQGKEYLAHLKVYTSKNLDGVDKDYVSFFEAVDVDQAVEDFIKAYWIYPNKIRFDLVELEEP
ncbi:MAG: hypothetical protein NWE98_03445 [Candidatus Bathyarchaeota archaeon]|nr:hypothetical protein [Candidatus Bathyarchaeota archaeon]